MSRPSPQIRLATRDDIPGIWDVRYAVAENTLRRGLILDEDVRCAIEDTGRGWVSTAANGRVLAFAIAVVDGERREGNVWALFVHPEAQGQCHGHRLHAQMLAWLRTQRVQRLWLGTGPGTRALGFYQRRGWVLCAAQAEGEDLVLEMHLPLPELDPGPATPLA